MPNAADEQRYDELRTILEGELQSTRRFVELLEEEKQRLAENRIEALSALLEEKGKLAETLIALGAGRETCLARLDAPKVPGEVGPWLEALGNAPLTAVWRDLLAVARKAQALNTQTGQTIAILSRNLQERLDALSVDPLQREHNDLYDPKGRTGLPKGARFSESV
ncbi:MAG: flagellar protein FlgN [Zoogloeaceae bacterium]|jgi:flagellar biosynthesis/type III secretory pathway chaperone|nr:flagellar protein FlgN [Zoogloeaceae bacterium]